MLEPYMLPWPPMLAFRRLSTSGSCATCVLLTCVKTGIKTWILVCQVAALAHDPQALEEAREAVAEADETLAVVKQQVAALEAETKPLEQVGRLRGCLTAHHRELGRGKP